MKKIITAALMAALVSAGAMVYAAGTPVQNRQEGDLKVDLNYGFNQKMGHHDAKSQFSGGDITYALNDKVDIQYDNNNTKIDGGSAKVNEHAVRAIYHINPYISAFGGATRVDVKNGYRDHSYEIGVGYNFTDNLDAHIKYRRDDVDVNNYDDDVKGWQVGVGYKF